MSFAFDQIQFDANGLIPAIVQDARSREVLTLAYMNAESLKRTLESNETWFWSRSRSELWHKGATSGNTQHVIEICQDCDGDALVVLVEPRGPACHSGARSCFSDGNIDVNQQDLDSVLANLYNLIERREKDRPEGSYTSYLFDQGLDKILKKIGEEASETIIAAKNEQKSALVAESADLLYHLMVLLVAREISLGEVGSELISRRKEGKS